MGSVTYHDLHLRDFETASGLASFARREGEARARVSVYVHGKLAIFRTAYLSNKLLFAEHRSGELGIIGFSLEWLAGVSPKSRSGFSRRYEERGGGLTESRKKGGLLVGGG